MVRLSRKENNTYTWRYGKSANQKFISDDEYLDNRGSDAHEKTRITTFIIKEKLNNQIGK